MVATVPPKPDLQRNRLTPLARERLGEKLVEDHRESVQWILEDSKNKGWNNEGLFYELSIRLNQPLGAVKRMYREALEEVKRELLSPPGRITGEDVPASEVALVKDTLSRIPSEQAGGDPVKDWHDS